MGGKLSLPSEGRLVYADVNYLIIQYAVKQAFEARKIAFWF